MNYLFFDIECANVFEGVGKICEFGYVLTDQDLNIIKQGNYLVNPEAEFDWYVKYKIISYPVEKYINAPKYPVVYEECIRELLELPDTVYVGHGVKDDVKYLKTAAKRYGLPNFDRITVDSSRIRMNFYGLPKPMSLKNLVKELGLGDHKKLHNSEYDAMMTLEYVRLTCRESGLSFAQLIEEYSVRKKETSNITNNETNEQANQPV